MGRILGLTAVLAAFVGLDVLAPPTGVLDAMATAASPSADPTALLTALVAAAAWTVLAWVAVSYALTLAARVPGTTGRLAARAAERITPTVLRGVIGVGAAASVALVPAVAGASAASAQVACGGPAAAGLPSLDRAPLPAPPCDPQPSTAPVTSPSTAPTTPSTPSTPSSPSSATDAAPPPAATVVVRPGDTLWALAAAELDRDHLPVTPAAVAARWPVWWQANRAVIGADPDLLHPGTVLRPPADPTVPSAPEETR